MIDELVLLLLVLINHYSNLEFVHFQNSYLYLLVYLQTSKIIITIIYKKTLIIPSTESWFLGDTKVAI